MISLIPIVFSYYLLTILFNALRTHNKRKKIRVGDTCSIYLGENKFKAFVMGIGDEIEVSVLNNIFRIPRESIYFNF